MSATTTADLDRAARTLQQIAAVPSLHAGTVSFDVIGLAGGWWHDADQPYELVDRVSVPVPGGADFAECRQKVVTAVKSRQAELLEWACDLDEARKRDARDRLLSYTEWLEVTA
ncbi:MAG: hypothetical protein QOF76_1580 [Solirubrobacteraceae bacterium]|nr:hypothetical protein [Solirubrobacteraceae bacterium]